MPNIQTTKKRLQYEVFKAVITSQTSAVSNGIECITPGFFAYYLVESSKNKFLMHFERKNVDEFLEFLFAASRERPKKATDTVKVSKLVIDVVAKSHREPDKFGPEHIFYVLVKEDTKLRTIAQQFGIGPSEILDMINKEANKSDVAKDVFQGSVKKSKELSKSDVVNKCCIDFTQKARDGVLSPVFCRQEEMDQILISLMKKNKANPLLIGEPGVGKAQPLDSLVLNQYGWKKMRDVYVGDLVVTPNGSLSKVVGLYPQGVKDIYKVSFCDGRFVKVSLDHLWKVYGIKKNNHKFDWAVMDTKTVIEKIKLPTYKRRVKIPLVEENVSKNIESLSCYVFSPYLMGALLGDGNFTDKSIRFSNSDLEMVDYVNKELNEKYSLVKVKGSEFDYRIARKVKVYQKYNKNDFSNIYNGELKRLGLFGKYSKEKFIPDCYKCSSFESKIAILQGLFDTDGTVGKNGAVLYSTSSLRLATDIQEVIWSIGGLCRITYKKTKYTYKGEVKNGLKNYILHVRIRNPRNLFRLSRKLIRLSDKYQYGENLGLKISGIEFCGREECQCIKIKDPNGLYITDNYVVTHNTAIVEGLAQRFAKDEVPQRLKGYKVVCLQLSSIIQGTTLRGQFEEKLDEVIKFVLKEGNVILFIDEIHTIIGAGVGSEPGLDAGNILKPYLARGDIKCIGATTFDDYYRYMRKDKALSRRFQRIFVSEPEDSKTIEIIKGLSPTLEKYHNCSIKDDVFDLIVKLCKKFVSDRFFPDKAIDCLDHACAKSSLKDGIVNKEIIEEVVSNFADIPISLVKQGDLERVDSLGPYLKSELLGNDKSISDFCNKIKFVSSTKGTKKGVLASMVLYGPSGVGKRTMVRMASEHLYGRKSIISINGAEYSESHSVSRLVGSPPGYVGHEEETYILREVRKKPHVVLLVQNPTSMHPSVMEQFRTIIETGTLTDVHGMLADFSNCIVVFVVDMLAKNGKTIGFSGNPYSESNYLDSFSEIKKKTPIFGTVNYCIGFNDVAYEYISKIVDMEISRFRSELENCGIIIECDEICVDFLRKSGEFSPFEVRMKVREKLEDAVAKSIVENKKHYLLTVENDKILSTQKD